MVLLLFREDDVDCDDCKSRRVVIAAAMDVSECLSVAK
jgi:hypothetical protein